MPTRRAILGVVIAGATAGCGSDDGQTPANPGGLAVSSPAFQDGGAIPVEFTADGADRSPPLAVGGVPAGARSLALVMEDPDAPSGRFVHWLLWNVPAERTRLPAGIPNRETVPALEDARQGTNDFDVLGYRGPAPPAADGPHTYRLRCYALDRTLAVEAGAGRDALEAGMADSVVASGRLSAEYDR